MTLVIPLNQMTGARERLRLLLSSSPLPNVLFSLIIDYTVSISIAKISPDEVCVLEWPSVGINDGVFYLERWQWHTKHLPHLPPAKRSALVSPHCVITRISDHRLVIVYACDVIERSNLCRI